MLLPYPDLGAYRRLTQRHVDWFIAKGVSPRALRGPSLVLLARGVKADDGLFDEDEAGEDWLVFPEAEDCIFWQPKSGELATWNGRAFAIGQDLIHGASIFAFDGYLRIFQAPLDYLRANRSGIIIVAWDRAFDELRDCPRLAVVESLLPKLKRHLQPLRLPEMRILREREGAAA